jgi:predicted outer membrane repeat protein
VTVTGATNRCFLFLTGFLSVAFLGSCLADRGEADGRTRDAPTLTNVTVNGNLAVDNGGGIYLTSASPPLTNVLLSYNTGENLFLADASSQPTLQSCTLYSPRAPNHNLETLPESNLEVPPIFVTFSNDRNPNNDDLPAEHQGDLNNYQEREHEVETAIPP